jgi:phage gp37-like protein
MAVDFDQVEDKIINEIQTTMSYVDTVDTYAGQLEGDIEKLPMKFPAVLVVYGGSKLSWVDGTVHNDKPIFKVLVAAKDLRGNEKARKKTYGCYRMLRDVLTNLTNKTFGLDIEKLVPVSVRLVFVSKSITVYGIDFETNFDTDFS